MDEHTRSNGMEGVESLFSEFAAMYGARMADMWRDTDVEKVKRTWNDALSGFLVREVKNGLLACRTKSWPPSLPEFLLLCRPHQNLEGLFEDAQKQLSRREYDDDKWTTKSLYWAAVEFGFYDLRSLPWQLAKYRWTRILLEKQACEDDLPPIPQRRSALPDAGKGFTDCVTARKNLAVLKTMIRNGKTINRRLST